MTDKTIAIVTGASRGLGEALAEKLLAQRTPLITVARHTNDALANAAKRYDTPLFQLQADLSSPDAAQAVSQKIASLIPDDIGQCVLINNAGTVEPVANTAELSDAGPITAALTLNIGSIMLICAAVLKASDRPGVDRRILNISSGAGRNPVPGWAVYCATKAAVDHYTRVLAQEHPNVRAASLAPGVIDTSMQETIRSSRADDFPNVARFVEMHEQGQLSPPEVTAGHIIRYLQRDDFGTKVLDDIRNYS